MVTKYHQSLEEGIVAFGKTLKIVKKVCRGCQSPLSITEAASKKVINYKPDVYFILKNRYKLLFQVLESELKKQDTLIADVIRACLVENCKGIIFIHPSENKEDVTRILEALQVIVRGLHKKGIPIEELPQKNNCYCINRKIANSSEEIIKLLSQYAKEERWFK